MSNEEEYTFCWSEYEQNFPKRFFKFLANEEFVDVTLVAEGHLVGVHRVILSAISPYFHAIFSESQKPYVMLDNITHRSMEYLVAYIYSGKVEVERRDLADFLRAAKFLRVQGIDDIDKNSDLNNSLSMPSNSISNQRTDNERNLDVVKCETIQCTDENSVNSDDSHDVEEENSIDSSHTDSFDGTFGDVNWTPDSEESIAHDDEEEEESYCTCKCPCPAETNNNERNQSVCTNVTCPAGRFNDANEELDFPPSKRARIDSSEFNIFASIRVSDKNIENLFYDDYKFTKQSLSKAGTIFWQCSLDRSNKCKARVSTKMIDGVMMMKVFRAEHTHPPPSERVFDDFNIVADIRMNDRNFENIHHDGYKFLKERVNKSSTKWKCTRAKCYARATTRTVNGIVVAKFTGQEHNHERKIN